MQAFKNNLFLVGLILIINLSNSVAAAPEKTLTYCLEISPTGFDANQSRTVPEHIVSGIPLYNRLIEFERGGTKLVPALAEKWEISEDGKVYTFHLRRDVKFHTTPWFTPSRDFNAEDVIFTFERMRNPKMPFRKAYPTEFTDFHHAGLDKVVSKIETLNKGHAVRFTLNSVYAPFLFKMAMPFASILSAEYASQLMKEGKPSDISWKPVGTGPFIFEQYIKDALIRYKNNPEYWNPNDVQLSRLIFDITPDAAVRVQKLKKNECQVVSSLRLTDIPALEHDPNIQILSQPGFNVSYLAYNTTHKPLGDVRVRRALDMAIDKQAIVNQVYEGHAQVAVVPMSPLQWSYDKTLRDAPRDLEKAKALLAQAGYKNGFTISLWIPSYNKSRQLTAEMIQADWKKIGVTVNIKTHEWGEFIQRATHGEHDALLVSWISNIPDPDNWLQIMSCDAARDGHNYSRWCNQDFDALIQKAVQTVDIEKRTQIYLKVQKIFKLEQPITPIAYLADYHVINRNVTGYKINAFGTTIFSGVGLQ